MCGDSMRARASTVVSVMATSSATMRPGRSAAPSRARTTRSAAALLRRPVEHSGRVIDSRGQLAFGGSLHTADRGQVEGDGCQDDEHQRHRRHHDQRGPSLGVTWFGAPSLGVT